MPRTDHSSRQTSSAATGIRGRIGATVADSDDLTTKLLAVWLTLLMISAGSVALVASPAFTGTASAASGADFQVTVDSTNSPITENESLTVTVNVTNDGSASGTQTITLTDPWGNQRDSVPVTLGSGASNDSVTLTWDTQVGQTGTGEVTVKSENDNATRTVTVYDRDDWPAAGHSRTRTGHNPHTTGPKTGAIEQWNVSTGGAVRSSPAVVDGTVYVGSDDSRVYALNATDGTERCISRPAVRSNRRRQSSIGLSTSGATTAPSTR